MNIHEYINSGIIEDYCLGVLSPEEMRQVALNGMKYKQIKTAIEEYELALRLYAEDRAMDTEINTEKQ
jgi:negative regulator of sigma E activity